MVTEALKNHVGKAPGFRNLPRSALFENTLPLLKDGKYLYYRAPALQWNYSERLSDRIHANIEIEDPGNFQIILVAPPYRGHDYAVDLFQELANNPLGNNPVAEYKSTPYGKDVEDDVKILGERVPETVYLVSSPTEPEDFILINRIASKYKKFPGVKKVVLVAPFMGGQREDKNAKLNKETKEIEYTGQSMTAASNMELLSRNIDEIINFEPHSSATQTWAAENGVSLAPVSLWKLMVNNFQNYLQQSGKVFNSEEYAFIRPDKGRNMGALQIEEFLKIKNKVNFKKDRDAEGNTFFQDLTQEQIGDIRGKNLLLYDDEGSTLSTMQGVISKIVSSNAGVKSINVLLGHARFSDGFIDKRGKEHLGWRENIDRIIELAQNHNPPIKLKFLISDSREALGNIYSYAQKHERLLSFISVVPLIRQVIEADIEQKNFWKKDSGLAKLLIQAKKEEIQEN